MHRFDIICGRQMPGQGCRCCCCCFWEAGGGWFLAGWGRFGCRGGEPPLLPPSSTFLVRQHLPFPGQETLRSISSQRRVKNPETQVPRHPTKPSFLASVFGAVVVRFVVGVVGFGVGLAVVWAGVEAFDGETTSSEIQKALLNTID